MKNLLIVAALACSTVMGQTSDWERSVDESRELRRQGRYGEAHRRLSELVELAENSAVANEPHARALNDLGGICVFLRRYDEGLLAYEESLRLLRSDSPRTAAHEVNEAMIMSALGAVYGELGNYKEAVKLLESALPILERTMGPRSSDYGIGLNNLASVRRMQGQFAEAERLMRRALPIVEEALGPKDLRTIVLAANLAWILAKLQRYTEADELSSRAVTALEATVGPNHPLLAEVLYVRAGVLKLSKRKAEAKLIYTRAQELTQTSRQQTSERARPSGNTGK